MLYKKIGRLKNIAGNLSDPPKIVEISRTPQKASKNLPTQTNRTWTNFQPKKILQELLSKFLKTQKIAENLSDTPPKIVKIWQRKARKICQHRKIKFYKTSNPRNSADIAVQILSCIPIGNVTNFIK